jgi:tRNA pseudouridine55 synthase
LDGFLGIDKPVGPTSFAVVRRLRGLLAERRVGHAGTLDPAASGVLVLALGRATRLLPYLPTEPKVYEFDIRLGRATDTLDESGAVVAESDRRPSNAGLEAALSGFRGEIEQSPPRFSAVKIQGRRAYQRARNHETFETRPRRVHVGGLQLLSYDEAAGVARCRVSCSGGTYVRSLAADIAVAAATVGHAASIRRLAVGRFTAETAIPADADASRLAKAVVSVRDAFSGRPVHTASAAESAELAFGREVSLPGVASQNGPVLVFDAAEELVAVVERTPAGRYRPLKVFVGAVPPEAA